MSSHFPSRKVSETSGISKKTKRGTWKHKFVCLPYHKQDKIPTYEVEKDEMFEAASTCEISIHIPTCITDYQLFKDNMVLALKGNDGFGIV